MLNDSRADPALLRVFNGFDLMREGRSRAIREGLAQSYANVEIQFRSSFLGNTYVSI
jgi:hypothetical protein